MSGNDQEKEMKAERSKIKCEVAQRGIKKTHTHKKVWQITSKKVTEKNERKTNERMHTHTHTTLQTSIHTSDSTSRDNPKSDILMF